MVDRIVLEKEIFELVSYIIVSARNLLEEPARYGPFRLVESASWLIRILEGAGVASDRLSSIRAMIEEGKHTVMSTEEEFKDFLESLVLTQVNNIDSGPS
ncbi:MAG: hypothetical protein JRH08_10810 [Deltaproteobacteria bacterium]|nr:hypothetical protein [Deltaproteobacteria bacterium]MBW1927656.1 hypothetical protein [Deltaproteobacteria bacterium]MBW2026258.1 hypothetical protein [Deltaproteobacteria bacterium]MBW2126168.1 hypothetical protein [Deltaproteobacteria bacterium]RLB22081.1 MAG: hypothetical protein DRG76_07565 [Deltaproteobacteria bacterium]